jgi:hypothetical protein
MAERLSGAQRSTELDKSFGGVGAVLKPETTADVL